MSTFVLLHGGFGGGWSFRHVRRKLQEVGHEVFTPTFTGLGERAHLAHRDIDLETHIADILGVLFSEDLRVYEVAKQPPLYRASVHGLEDAAKRAPRIGLGEVDERRQSP